MSTPKIRWPMRSASKDHGYPQRQQPQTRCACPKRVLFVMCILVAGLLVGCGRGAFPSPTPVDWGPVNTVIGAALDRTMTAESSRQTPSRTSTPSPAPTFTPTRTRIATPSLKTTPSSAATRTPRPTITTNPLPTSETPPTPDVSLCEPDFAFVRDITIPDDTVVRAGDTFTKTWALSNTGTCEWDEGYLLVHSGGARLGSPDWVPLPQAQAGDPVQVSVTLQAPLEPGTYRGDWRLCAGLDDCFGPRLYVRIVVAEPTPVPPPP